MKDIILEFPLRGAWKAFHIPGHHRLAYDFIGTDDDGRGAYLTRRRFRNVVWGGSAEDWRGFGRPVHAPCDGVVVSAGDGWPDRMEVGFMRDLLAFLFLRKTPAGNSDDPRAVAGNFVMIRHASGYVAFLCHMRAGSLRVKTGDAVRAGARIGEVGNSGNSFAPHLHFNLFDRADEPVTGGGILRALSSDRVLPFAFARYVLREGGVWRPIENALPKKGSIIRS